MESSEYKANIDGMQSANHNSHVKMENPRSIKPSHLLLRFIALATTLAAAVVMGVAEETKTVPFTLISGMPPLHITVPAKTKYVSAFVYFVVVNAIAAAYSLFSLLATVIAGSGARGLSLLILAVDLLMLALLSSGCGAAAAIGYIGYHGNKHVGWNKVCDLYGKFCKHVAGSVIVSLIGAMAFIVLLSLSILNLHLRSR